MHIFLATYVLIAQSLAFDFVHANRTTDISYSDTLDSCSLSSLLSSRSISLPMFLMDASRLIVMTQSAYSEVQNLLSAENVG